MIYEIRRYRARPGRRDEWVAYMESTVLPFQTGRGIDVVASFVVVDEDGDEDADGYVWIRRFTDEDQRTALYAAVYGSDEWRTTIGPAVRSLLLVDQSTVTRAVPTPASALQ